MAHYKRRRPKHQRAGCLFCKPHKDDRGPQSLRVAVTRRLEPLAYDRHDPNDYWTGGWDRWYDDDGICFDAKALEKVRAGLPAVHCAKAYRRRAQWRRYLARIDRAAAALRAAA